MSVGAYISGAGHLALILWVILGGVIFRADDTELEATNVRLLDTSEYLALSPARPEPAVAEDVTPPEAPATEDNQVTASLGDTPPELAPRPEISDPVDPDATPQTPSLKCTRGP